MKSLGLAWNVLLNVKRRRGFTLIEILVVMTIIGILMALVIGVAGPVQQAARVYRTRGEIAGIETALTRFETDNGFIPTSIGIAPNGTNGYAGDPGDTKYVTASKALFLALTGKHYFFSTATSSNVGPNYFTSLKSGQVYNPPANPSEPSGKLSTDYATYSVPGNLDSGDYIMDAWGNPYGFYYDGTNTTNHSVFNQVTFDVWSTSGETNGDAVTIKRWTSNWPN